MDLENISSQENVRFNDVSVNSREFNTYKHFFRI